MHDNVSNNIKDKNKNCNENLCLMRGYYKETTKQGISTIIKIIFLK